MAGGVSGRVVFAALAPHPPVLVPAVGGEAAAEVHETAAALERLAEGLAGSGADALALVTPHGPVRAEAACLYRADRLEGDFAAFGAPEAAVALTVDRDLAEAVLAEAEGADLPVLAVRPDGLDHGSLVPLYFLQAAGALRPAVVLTPPWRLPAARRLGRVLAGAARRARRRLALVASGDLSHRLKPGAPGGYAPEGREFDERLVELLRAGDAEGILEFPRGLAEAAGQDVLPGLAVLLGALAGRDARPEVLSYEGPFGVGYAVAVWRPGGPRRESAPVRAARRALELHLREGVDDPGEIARRLAAEFAPGGTGAARGPEDEADLLGPARGVFVSLKEGGELRGCTGTIGPTRDTLLEEIVHAALGSAERDPRFPPVGPDELGDLDVSVDVLEPPEPVSGPEDLDPRRFGVVVAKGARRGLLLPDLPGITRPGQQYALACRKAGLDPDDPGVAVYRFRARRYR